MHDDSKKQKLEEEKDNINKEVVLQLPDIPLCIIYDIMSWLPVVDILRYRCVCKAWCDLTKDPCFIQLQSRRSVISGHPPFVVIVDGGRCLFHNITGNANRRWGDTNIPYTPIRLNSNRYGRWGLEGMELNGNTSVNGNSRWGWNGRELHRYVTSRWRSEGMELAGNIIVTVNSRWGDVQFPDDTEITDGVYVASCNGFICISQRRRPQLHQIPSIVYNPITRQKIRLPKFDQFETSEYDSQFQCRFGFDEMTNRYKVMLDFIYKHVVAIITVGADHSWRFVDLPCEIREFFRRRKGGGFFFNGGFHWLFAIDVFSVEGILTLDIITEKFQTTIFSTPLHIDNPTFLQPVQLGNSIGLIHENDPYYDLNRDIQSKVIKIWKILGAKPDGSCDYQFKTLNFPDDQRTPFHKSYMFRLLAFLSSGDFLFKVKHHWRHYLVLYDQQKDEPSYFVDMGIRLRDKNKFVEMGTFLPTLMSISPGGH